ncbi:MAG: LytR family transcriptional regulator [Chloroflexi bacterium]|nr:MAG: LytR family transcriptional regulator [Chloroflexota bacterium]
MTRLKKVFLLFLSALACFVVVAAWAWMPKWQQPLGPALQIATVTPFQMPATWTPDANVMGTLQATSTGASVSQASPLPTVTEIAGLCGAPPVMNILAIGADTRGNNYDYGLADVIRLVRVDFVNPKVTILEIPRDLWVEIPDIADNLNGQDHEKLNQAYLYGNPGMGYTDDPAQGPGLLARTLTLNFGTRIDHYAAVNMRTFEKMVNAVGGVDVTLPATVDGRTPDDRNKRLLFLAGTHHLNGPQALTLARIRIAGGFARAENQNRVLCALRDKLTSSGVVTQIPELIQAFQDAIQTDLSPEQLSQLACIGTQIPSGNIVFATFPPEHFKQTREYDPVFKKRVSVWDVDFEVLREYISQFHDGTWPGPATVPTGDTGEEEASFCE